MPGCRLPDACEQLGLDAAPSITILELRLVQDFEHDPFDRQWGETGRQVVPENCETRDAVVVSFQGHLEIRRWMDIDYGYQTGIDDHLDCSLEFVQPIQLHDIDIPGCGDRRGVHTETHVVKSESANECDIGSGRVSDEMLPDKPLRDSRLSEPMAEIEPALERRPLRLVTPCGLCVQVA